MSEAGTEASMSIWARMSDEDVVAYGGSQAALRQHPQKCPGEDLAHQPRRLGGKQAEPAGLIGHLNNSPLGVVAAHVQIIRRVSLWR